MLNREWLGNIIWSFSNTLLPPYIAVQYNAISDTTRFWGPQIIFKGSADIRNSSILAHIAIENTGFI